MRSKKLGRIQPIRETSDTHHHLIIVLLSTLFILVVVYIDCATATPYTTKHQPHNSTHQHAARDKQARIGVRQAAIPGTRLGDGGHQAGASTKSRPGSLYSLNNRGPLRSAHLLRPPQRPRVPLADGPRGASSFGERRRSGAQSSLTGSRPTLLSQLFSSGEQASSARSGNSWSQPDPRRSYSLPVSLIKIPGRRRASDQSTATRRASELDANATSTSEPPADITTTSASNSSEDFVLSPSAANPLGDQTSESAAAPDVQRQPQVSSSARGRSDGQMVSLIRYVPVVVNLPADHLVAIAAAAASAAKSSPAAAPARLTAVKLTPSPASAIKSAGELHSASIDIDSQQQAALIDLYRHNSPKYQLVAEQNGPPLAENQQASASGDMNSDFSQLYTSTSALLNGAESGPVSNSPFNNYNSQQQLTRLAYLQPVGQPAQFSPSTYAASKALSAYASRLLSMLRPSALLSSIGGVYSQATQQHSMGLHTQQPKMQPQIYLLAPADSMESLAASGQRSVGHHIGGVAPTSRPDDLLINQASKVHSTKSNSGSGIEGQSASSYRWSQQQSQQKAQPQSGQLLGQGMQPTSGLICIQGMIGRPQMQQQPQLSNQLQAQQQLDDTFDYEKPSNEITTNIQQQQIKSSGQQQQVTSGTKSGTKGRQKGSAQTVAKESPVRLMQKMAFKANQQRQQQTSIEQSGQSNEDQVEQQQQQQEQPIRQLKLMGQSSESRSAVTMDAGDVSEKLDADQTDGHSNRISGKDGKPIIPFTIRDKLDVSPVVSRGRLQLAGGTRKTESTSAAIGTSTNSPVQYDDDGNDHFGNQWSSVPSHEERRAKTTFVSSTHPTTIFERQQRQRSGQSQPPPHIDYRKEAVQSVSGSMGNGLGNSLPILMASSTSSSSRNPSAIVETRGPQFTSLKHEDVSSELLGSGTPAFLRPSVVFKSGAYDSNNLINSQFGNSASSSELIRQNLKGYERKQQQPSRLISSVSLHDDELEPFATSSQPTTVASSTVELVVNSSPVSPVSNSDFSSMNSSITASPMFPSQSTTPIPSKTTTSTEEYDYTTTATTTSLPSDLNDGQQSHSAQTTTTTTPSSFHSHDRSLSSGAGQFDKISESLQTNPLDLIDLQNSRSSFELPSQLESLTMLLPQSSQKHSMANSILERKSLLPVRLSGELGGSLDKRISLQRPSRRS